MRRWSRALLAPSSRPWELLRCACVQGSAVSVLNLATTGREAREAGREVPGLTPPSPSLRLPSALSGTRLYRNGRPPPASSAGAPCPCALDEATSFSAARPGPAGLGR